MKPLWVDDTRLVDFEPDFSTCFEVDQDLIDEALAPAERLADPAPRDKIFALIEHMSRVARPRQGAARLLVVLARLAECAWLEGELEVLLCDLGETTGIDVMLHDGLSFVRLHPPLRLGVPFSEFSTAVERDPLAFSPLEQAPADLDVLRLRATEATLSRGAHRAAELPAPEAGQPSDFTSKPTVKVHAVKIPREAYRDGQAPPAVERDERDDGQARVTAPISCARSVEPVTIRMEAVRPAQVRAAPADDAPETQRSEEDIDAGWD